MDITEQLQKIKEPYLNTIRVLDHGEIKLIDWIGSDERIVQAARVSYGAGTKTVREDKGLIDYLIRNSHTSPLEQVQFTFYAKMPIFVARQWVRHRTAKINEISARFSIFEDEFYVPDISRMQTQSAHNKQGSSEELIPNADEYPARISQTQSEIYQEYESHLNAGMARELARINLPVSIYTKWYISCDLHNLFHFLKLRLGEHAQYEIKVYARAMYDLIKPIVPYACESFERHILNGKRFSSDEYELMKNFFSKEDLIEFAKQQGWKDSNIQELSKKL